MDTWMHVMHIKHQLFHSGRFRLEFIEILAEIPGVARDSR
jgi:hypothetical protein